MVERAVILAEGGFLDVSHFPLLDAGTGLPRNPLDFSEEEAEKIQEALRQTSGKLSETAKLLGLTYDSLRYRLKKLGIDPAGSS